MPQITTRPHNVTGYAAAVVADKRRHLTTYVMLKAMQERNFCSQGMIVTSDANDFVRTTLKAMQERDLCSQGNHYVTSPFFLFLQLSHSPELQMNVLIPLKRSKCPFYGVK